MMKIIEKIAANDKDYIENPSATIVCLGDSITQGLFRGYANAEAVYHNRMRKKLNFLFPNAVINVINAGIGGGIAEFALNRLDRDVFSRNPDLCIVSFALNDANCKKLETYKESLEKIFVEIKKRNIEVIFMTPNMMNTYVSPLTEEEWKDYATEAAKMQNEGVFDTYINAAIAVAEKNNVPVCNCYAKWKKMYESGVDTTALLANAINHPKEEMHELFANSLLEVMFNN